MAVILVRVALIRWSAAMTSAIRGEAEQCAGAASFCELLRVDPRREDDLREVPLIAKSVAASATIVSRIAASGRMPGVKLTSVQRDVAQPG
jgi:hypothetical protein